MRLEHYPLSRLKREIKSIAGKYVDLSSHALFFFGSRVAGTGDAHSDIDIGIEGEEPVPRVAMRKMKEEIGELPTLYKIELVDFQVVSSDFINVAKQHIEKIT